MALPPFREMRKISPGCQRQKVSKKLVWPSNKFNRNNIVNNSNIITNHVLYVGPSDTVFSQFDIFETSEDMTYTPLTLDEYDIDLNDDLQIQEEFPVLKAGMTKTQTSNRPEQTEAQKEEG